MTDLEFKNYLYGSIMQIERCRAREIHFRNMHLYLNALFEDVNDVLGYHHDDKCLKENHRVHIFMWNVNTDDKTMWRMIEFILKANELTSRTVYVHIPNLRYMGVRRTEQVYAMLEGQITTKEDKIYGILPRVKICQEDIKPVQFTYGKFYTFSSAFDNTPYASLDDVKFGVGFNPEGEYAYPILYRYPINGKSPVQEVKFPDYEELDKIKGSNLCQYEIMRRFNRMGGNK